MPEIYLTQSQLDRFHQHCQKDPGGDLVQTLTGKGDQALEVEPLSVMDKNLTAPSGDKHDYLRMPTYAWPNPDTPDGQPYLHRDGEPGPHINSPDYDKARMSKMTSAVNRLAWAALATGQEKYTEHAAHLLYVWFVDPESRMNPNLTFSKYTPGDKPPYATGVIATHGWVEMMQAFAILGGYAAWTDGLAKGLHQWFTDYLEWLQTSPQGLAEKGLGNNRGTWYDAQVVAFARFTGNDDLALRVLRESCLKRLDEQIAGDGSLPKELERTISLSYTLMTLKGWAMLALMGDRLEFNLWHWTTRDGRGLRLALDYAGPYISRPGDWPHQQIKPVHAGNALFTYRGAAQAYQDPSLLEPFTHLDNNTIAAEPAMVLFP